MDSLRAAHVHSTLPVVAVDVMGLESLNEGRESGFEPDCGEGVVFDDLFVVDSKKLCEFVRTAKPRAHAEHLYHMNDGNDCPRPILSSCRPSDA